MINSECLRVFEERLAQKIKKQLGKLDEDIHSGKARAAAKGLALSGFMINEVKGLCIRVLELRVDYIFEILTDLPFRYSRMLGASISEISLKYFPANLGEVYTRLDAIIRFTNNERARDSVINKVLEVNNTEIERFRNLLDQFLLNLKINEKSLIRKIWEHPVWSKVIAGVILAICGVIVKIVWDKLTK